MNTNTCENSIAAADGENGVASGLYSGLRIPFRWQILLSVAAASIFTLLLAGLLSSLDARERAKVETSANMDLWQGYITSKASSFSPQWGIEIVKSQLERELRHLRHVHFTMLDANGVEVKLAPTPRNDAPLFRDESTEAPDWYVALVQPEPEVREFPIWVNSRMIGLVRLTANPADEITEGWEFMRQVSVLWTASTGLMLIGLYFLLGHLLSPLTSFAAGMRELEDGHYDFRVGEPQLQELEPIARNFNTLAGALEAAQADNTKLHRQLIALQEDERRHIAAELHDEIGPCLFGISTGVASIDRIARELHHPEAAVIRRSASEIAAINERLKVTNRALLGKLRPVALGRVTISELLNELVAGFERRHPDVEFSRSLDVGIAKLDDSTELTLYRCLQEGLTNALKHGNASRIDTSLSIRDEKEIANGRTVRSRGPDSRLELIVNDNGSGLREGWQPGFGLSVMRERVRSVSGSMTLEPRQSGARLTVEIPMHPKPSSEQVANANTR